MTLKKSLLLLTLLIVVPAAFGQVSVSSPTSGSINPTSVHFVASAKSANRVTAMRIYVDSISQYLTSSASLDTTLNLAAGAHNVTVKAWDNKGVVTTKQLSITVSADLTVIPTTATAYKNIEEMSGWDGCTDCAGGGANGIISLTRVSTPSLDGLSGQVFDGGTTPFSHSLWWKRLASSTGAETHFVLDMYYYIKEPAKSFGLEFAINQAFGGKRYKFSTQCSFNKGIYSTWDSANSKWVATTVPCTRPVAFTWQHVVFEYARQNGMATFVAFTINGHKYYVNKAFLPENFNDNGIATHFQINGNQVQDDYYVWFDKMNVYTW